jgi:heptosyltransferase-3
MLYFDSHTSRPLRSLSWPVRVYGESGKGYNIRVLQRAKKILVINLRYIGDSIWMYPFIRNLKRNLPDAEITVMVNEGSEAFLRLLPDILEVIPVRRREIKGRFGIINFIGFLAEIRRKKFDAAFVLSNADRPAIISFASGAKIRIGFESDSCWRGFLFTERFRWDAEKNPHLIEHNLQALTDAGLEVFDKSLTIDVPEGVIGKMAGRFGVLKRRGEKTIIVHPGARTELRRWGPERFAKVINAISGHCRVFLIGGPAEGDIIRDVLAGVKKEPEIVSTDLGLLEFAALCTFGDLFVGNDSAPIHIAAATGLFVIGIYGPTFAGYCGPWTDRKALFDISKLPCRMCDLQICVNEEKKACLNIVTPEMVIEKIREVISKE